MCDANQDYKKKAEKLIETNVRGFTESAKTNSEGAADTLGINTEQITCPRLKSICQP